MKKDFSRRTFLSSLGGALSLPFIGPLASRESSAAAPRPRVNGNPSVITPGIPSLPFEWDGNVKVFRLVAEPVVMQWPDGSDPHGVLKRPVHGWGYNGTITGPTIEAVEGDRVRIHVENRLSEPTTVHWHGLHIPLDQDGVPGFSQKAIEPGETFTYEFTLEQHGTYFYHPHFMGAKQVGLGMAGFFIIHPKNPLPHQIVDHDYAYFLQIWMLHPGSPIPDVMEMTEFNFFTMNGKPGPDIVPMKARTGEKVRIRVANLSMLTHPIHLHGHSYRVTDYGAGFVPPSQQLLMNTNNISSAEARAFEFEAYRPGKWLFHCHFMHHNMNDMHRKPIPGAGGHGGHAGHEGMDMGGMHTWIEVTP